VKQKHIDAHMKVAQIYASLSTAIRLKVGAIVVKDNRVLSIGYNGMPSGWDNNCEEVIGQVLDDNGRIVETRLKTKPEVIHAEANAIAKLAKSTDSGDGADMFLTHAPCIDCAKQIFTSGIKKVYFGEHYRNEDGLTFLEKCGIEIVHVS
jgi:dCMP deaminase